MVQHLVSGTCLHCGAAPLSMVLQLKNTTILQYQATDVRRRLTMVTTLAPSVRRSPAGAETTMAWCEVVLSVALELNV